MADEKLSNILSKGSYGWNEWRHENPNVMVDLHKTNLLKGKLFDKANFSSVDLSEADLSGADLTYSNFTYANLSGANLSKTYLHGAHLSHTILYKADLREANFSQAELTEADFREANFSGANFSGTNLHGADLRGANLQNVNLSGVDLRHAKLSSADLTGADLSGSVLVRTDLRGAILTNCNIYGIAVWDIKLEGAKQDNLVITPQDQAIITVDNLKIAQFIYLLLNNAEIREAIDTIAKKAVLILGRFTPERKSILDALRDELRTLDFLPIVFDFERPTERDFTETIMTLAGLSSFIIADITNPKSSPLELQATVPNYMIPFVPIIQEGEHPFSMFVNLQQRYNWVLDVRDYDTTSKLIQFLEQDIVKPALEKRNELLAKKVEELRIRHIGDPS